MAMTPTQSAAPPTPPMPDDTAAPADDAAAPDSGDDSEVLLTVCKESDGTYSLIKGDEEDADGADAAGSATDADKQTFDSPGPLLKAILDILNEDEGADGGEGGGDQFQAGFDGDAPPKPASPMAQKY